MYPGVEFRRMQYVVAVAEFLSFSRAAESLHVSQPALSKQIADVEEQLGVKLFERTKRNVALTKAGEVFVQEAKQALDHTERAVHLVQSIEPSRRFALGYSPHVNHRLLMDVRRFSQANLPDVQLQLRSDLSRTQIELVRNGELDAALVLLPIVKGDLALEILLRESLVVALPQSHRLARSRSIGLAELNDVPAIIFPRALHPEAYDHRMESCRRAGLRLQVKEEVAHFLEAFLLVANGAGFAFTRDCFKQFRPGGIVFRPIKGNPLFVETGIVYSRQRQSAHLEAYLSALRNRNDGRSSSRNAGQWQLPLRASA